MSPRTGALSDEVERYIETVGVREHEALAGLRAATDTLPDGAMRSSVVQAQLLALLIEIIGARTVLEIGCFTGYGTLAMALALPEDGRIVSLDVNDHWVAIGRRFWASAGVEERVDFRPGLAVEGLAALADASFDLVYVDADKRSYRLYYEEALRVARCGGIVALDNVLWRGAVADLNDTSRQARSLRELNAMIHTDQRVTPVLLPIGDGLTIARRR